MNVNKKLDRFKQWAGERMGGEVKTSVSDDFKAMEIEMGLRQEGLDRMQRSMNQYVKSISKRSEIDVKEKSLPIAHLGGTMITHGEDFDPDSEFGQCLNLFGRTQERLARAQETYIASATNSWLESLDRATVQMKEYQASRKKLESRRLAYDTSLAKMQKAKREDFRVEEELRSQKAKYEESEDDVFRRMEEIRETDPENVADLAAFLEAELAYHDQCREALLQLKEEWPTSTLPARGTRSNPRSRSNTIRSYTYEAAEERQPTPEPRPTIRSAGRTASARFGEQEREYSAPSPVRPPYTRAATTYDGQSSASRDRSPAGLVPLARVPSDSFMVRNARSNLRNVDTSQDRDVFGDDSAYYLNNTSERSFGGLSSTTSQGSNSTLPIIGKKKPPPPPPPSRATKPAPPPLPSKRSSVIY